MSAHFHFLDLRQQQKRAGNRESEREQINCIIPAYKLNPQHECSSGGSAFCRDGGVGKTARDRLEDESRKPKWKGWRRFNEKVALVCEGKGESYGERERGGGLVRKTIVPFKFTGVEYLI